MNVFRVDVPDATLDELRSRLARTRWPDAVEGAGWRQGTEPGFLKRVCDHWSGGFDWRAHEARLNSLPQFRAQVDGVGLHLVHARAKQADATPLLLANGWPSSIFEYVDVIPRLVAAGFHVVAPALPGFGFSDRPTRPGTSFSRIADLFAGLMTGLGYGRFIAHGSDLGAGVVEATRRRHAGRLLGAHFSNVYWGYPRPENPTPEEERYFAKVRAWQLAEGAYSMLHATKPQTLAYGLNDSPAGLAAWILEKFESWSDGGAEAAFGIDALCANLTLYWTTETIGSSARLYAEAAADPGTRARAERGSVPVGVIVFPKDILPAPRQRGERWLNIVHWTDAPRGGHFGAWEAPELFAGDLEKFAGKLR